MSKLNTVRFKKINTNSRLVLSCSSCCLFKSLWAVI